MKKSLLVSILSIFLAFYVFFLSGKPTNAQSNTEVPRFEFDSGVVADVICALFHCDEGASDEVIPTPGPLPTPDPHATPRIFPTPSGPVPTTSPLCAAPGGRFICGSKNHPLNGCAHCGVGYPANQQALNCNKNWGTEYAVDIARRPFEPVLLPALNGHSIEWTHYKEKRYATNAIERYTGTDYIAKKKYLLQFHHSQIGSGIGLGRSSNSGAVGARICATCDHVHIQIAESDWIPATDHYCD